jgi:hypothetical protein
MSPDYRGKVYSEGKRAHGELFETNEEVKQLED